MHNEIVLWIQPKLRKKMLTVIEKAIVQIIGFKELYQAFEDRILISGLSSSALNNYARRVAEVYLHFNRLPKDTSEKGLDKYLADMAREGKSPCLSNFKFTVYGLRHFYRLSGINDRIVELPSIKAKKKLPVVLNYQECKALFKSPALLKHRVLLALIYSAGLRVSEASRLRLSDVDSGRMMIHIRQSKNDKERYQRTHAQAQLCYTSSGIWYGHHIYQGVAGSWMHSNHHGISSCSTI